ncbi:hypothetical protein [Citreimonas salinaria]|uniref:Uncharacterized protein n=1 Tax=Citreimonas salinaria TaxID=321339 RepID=A0A1H3L5M3_9RHOB|nr:hypothetical protein [Citreimonas salinaria]SDY59640.1 hypothetical protein SAMN05444340_111105 [Citreimonas salinaria]
MTRRSKGFISVAVVAVIVVLALGWLATQDDSEMDRQHRTGEGSNLDGISGQTEDGVLQPEGPGVFIEGSTNATDTTAIQDPDPEVPPQEGSAVQPDQVISPERGEVQNDTGMVTVEPDLGVDGDAYEDEADGAETDTQREEN